MEKNFQYSTQLIMCFLLFINCSKGHEKPFILIDEIEGVKDSIISLRENYKEDFLLYFVNKSDDHIELVFEIPNKPFYLATNYKFKKLYGVSLIYLSNNKPMDKDKIEPEVAKLISQKKIEISDYPRYTDNWYLKFVYCKDDPQNIIVFDKTEYENSLDSILMTGSQKVSHTKFLYPKCN